MDFRVLVMGDCAFTVEFSKVRGIEGASCVRALRQSIEALMATGNMTDIIDMMSTSRSLTICLSPACENYNSILERVSHLAGEARPRAEKAEGLWRIPVCYESEYGPDLEEIGKLSGLSSEDIIKAHMSGHYVVLMIGFLPGFPFMAEVDKRLQFPRRVTPRTRVPAGSVAIANDQTAIYPWESPGGWHLIGRCPIPLFNPNWRTPSLLKPGEKVTFEEVSQHDYALLEKDMIKGTKCPKSFYGGTV